MNKRGFTLTVILILAAAMLSSIMIPNPTAQINRQFAFSDTNEHSWDIGSSNLESFEPCGWYNKDTKTFELGTISVPKDEEIPSKWECKGQYNNYKTPKSCKPKRILESTLLECKCTN